jgi:hypothetical protein
MCLLLLSTAAAACGGGNGLPIGADGTTGPNVTGTWIGSASDSTRQITMTWRLLQQDRSVSGTFSATTPVGADVYTSGSISGTVLAGSLTFTITVPRGSVVDAPDCIATFAGTADDLMADSMAGTYTGSDTCGGTFTGGRFTLLKQ